MHTKFWLEGLQGGGHLVGLGVDGRASGKGENRVESCGRDSSGSG
jgi:hypothetical protein